VAPVKWIPDAESPPTLELKNLDADVGASPALIFVINLRRALLDAPHPDTRRPRLIRGT
jgi:hypothetical protein